MFRSENICDHSDVKNSTYYYVRTFKGEKQVTPIVGHERSAVACSLDNKDNHASWWRLTFTSKVRVNGALKGKVISTHGCIHT